MVDLEPLDDEDRQNVAQLIERHVALTGSPRGNSILARWTEYALKFVKVFPHDYKRVLTSAATAKRKPAINAQEVPVG